MSTERDTPPRVSDARLAHLCSSFDPQNGNFLTYPIRNTEWHHTVLDLRDCRAEVAGLKHEIEDLRGSRGEWQTHATNNAAIAARIGEERDAANAEVAALRARLEAAERLASNAVAAACETKYVELQAKLDERTRAVALCREALEASRWWLLPVVEERPNYDPEYAAAADLVDAALAATAAPPAAMPPKVAPR